MFSNVSEMFEMILTYLRWNFKAYGVLKIKISTYKDFFGGVQVFPDFNYSRLVLVPNPDDYRDWLYSKKIMHHVTRPNLPWISLSRLLKNIIATMFVYLAPNGANMEVVVRFFPCKILYLQRNCVYLLRQRVPRWYRWTLPISFRTSQYNMDFECKFWWYKCWAWNF